MAGDGRKRIDIAVGIAGVLVLLYAAYSAIQYRAMLKIKEEEFTGVPTQISLQILASLALCFWAALSVPGTFLDILPDSKANRLVELPENFDLITFNHRGKLFPPKLDRLRRSS